VTLFSGAGASRLVFDRVRIQNNTDGLLIQGTGLAAANVHVRDSLVVRNTRNGITAARTATVFVDHTSASDNGAAGILATAPGATVILGGATITRNGTGLVATSGGTIESYQNNQASGNDSDGLSPLTLPLK